MQQRLKPTAPARPSKKPKPAPGALRGMQLELEPKTFLANERTYLTWLHMAIMVGSISTALLGFAASAPRANGEVHIYGAALRVES